ncbi:MAG TPA: lysozyme inhibitor LprI family protein [Syntrophobacteraceae bacterium]|nr:lysozyme inhibitor LprI family protein [Syntrophobacteraceae bacterium]
MWNFAVWICVPLMLCAAENIAVGAGFDCTKASSKSEKLICSNEKLSSLDDRLGEVYGRALKKSPDKEALKREQVNWIKSKRDACPDAPCMAAAYEARISALENTIRGMMPKVLQEARERFTFERKPINPRALQELLPWLADNLPGPVAVDVEGTAADTNRYFADVTVGENGQVSAKWTEEKENMIFSYQRLGVLGDGVQVIQTWSRGGGTMVSTNLILVKFTADTEYVDGGAVRDRLLMVRTGAFGLGDRYNGTIQVKAKEITIGAGGVLSKPETILFK